MLFSLRAVFPIGFYYDDTNIRSVNGSTMSQLCNETLDLLDDQYKCIHPTSSVLFDREFPTTLEFAASSWASQLITLWRGDLELVAGHAYYHRYYDTITFSFNTTRYYRELVRAEFVLFNCPQWG